MYQKWPLIARHCDFVILEALAHAAYQNKFFNGKGNSPGVIPVKTSRAEKGAGNRVMEPTTRLDIARDRRL
jgi:hypothetical protein